MIICGADTGPQSRQTQIRNNLFLILSKVISVQIYYKQNILYSIPSKLSGKLP